MSLSPTVARTLMKASKGLSPKGNYLPNHLGVDEFKSTSRVADAMSAVLVDTHNRRLIDIIVDRKRRRSSITFLPLPGLLKAV